MEERVYRHRCVETWSLVVPWTGFPLRKLLAAVGPLPAATFVRFETALLPDVFPQQRTRPAGYAGAPWPYVEGLTLAEAWNDLPFLVIGQAGAPLAPQNGAPLRLVVPHKYGFKSAKSLRRISLETAAPLTWWAGIAPSEYGFYANVHPAFPHPRWSQAQETPLVAGPGDSARIPTTPFNGYAAEVEHLYGTTREFFY
jgi:sulfoxide reductase catalytic subunit YedY